GALRAVAGAAGALLRIHLLAGAPDVGAGLHRVRAGAPLGELPLDAALEGVDARLEAEDRGRQGDRGRLRAVEGCDFQLHLTPPLSPARRLPPAPRWSPRPGGTCRASAHPSAAASSPRHAP